MLASAVVALGSLVLLTTKPLAALDKRYVDADGDLVADTPDKPSIRQHSSFRIRQVRNVRSTPAYGMAYCGIWKG
jgi:hypothetical protein